VGEGHLSLPYRISTTEAAPSAAALLGESVVVEMVAEGLKEVLTADAVT
jgi:hypothetical protein